MKPYLWYINDGGVFSDNNLFKFVFYKCYEMDLIDCIFWNLHWYVDVTLLKSMSSVI